MSEPTRRAASRLDVVTPRSRALLTALAALFLHALAREVDRGLGLLLTAGMPPAGVPRELARAVAADGSAVAFRLLAWLAGGTLVFVLLAAGRSRRERIPFGRALESESATFAPLLLRPVVTLLALLSVALRSSYPYGFTLPVALTQDWAVAQDAAALAALLAMRVPAWRWPAPRAGEVSLVAFLAYALLVPGSAWVWEGHPGNEPKYLRQAVALGQFLTFDAEGVSAAMEDLPTRPVGAAVADAASTLARESGRMAVALVRGEAGRAAIRATRITRQTIRGKDGGVFYVLAPGPSILLAPALRIDRALGAARGVKGPVAAAVLVWCVLAALLVGALHLLVRDATGSGRLAAALALGFALLPPFVFYSFQFYPEMVAALVLAVAFRTLALRPEGLARHPWLFGWMLATLPWLHQKFLPVFVVLSATALWVAVRTSAASPASGVGSSVSGQKRRNVTRIRTAVVVGLLVPQALSLYLTALYNFAITGSVRPDALFLAWGPGGVTTARVGQGFLGLLFDARYGILPYVPVLMLASAGLARPPARRLAVVLPSAAVYYLTVASADNWAGAVCNLGRYVMPIVPLAVALVGIALASQTGETRTATVRRGAVAIALTLAAWSGLVALALWRDPLAANDSARLLARSTYADGNQYVPNLFIRHWSDAAPGVWARIAAWATGLALLGFALPRATSVARALAGLLLAILALGFLLERWPPARTAPVFADAVAADGETLVLFEGAVRVREDEAILGPGRVEMLIRRLRSAGSVSPERPLRAIVGGEGVLQIEEGMKVPLRPGGGVVDLPILSYHVVSGGDGRAAAFSRLSATVSGQAVMRFGDGGEPGPASPPPPPTSREPDERAEPDEPGLR